MRTELMFRLSILTFLINFCLSHVSANGQDSTLISFKEKVIDFQVIYEADGNVPVTFEFTNSGKYPLKINRIISPGLTSIKFPKDSIAPGQKGEIQASVNPFAQTGYFSRKVNVFSNTINSPNELTIKGKIVGGTLKSSFKYTIGDLAFKQLQLNFGYIYQGDKVIRYIPVLNKSEVPLELSFTEIPSHLSISTKFKKLAPGNTGLIEIVYNTTAISDWDFVIDKINLIIKGDTNILGQLMVTANIRENFLLLTEDEKLNKPRASLPIKVYNYDTISSGDKVQIEFPVYNKGTRDLNIRSVKPTCGCTAVIPQKNIISPGDSTLILVEFNSLGFSGNNKKGVTVITNDPVNYKHFLWVTGYIE